MSGIESLLFISGEPLSFARLAKTLSVSEADVEAAVKALAQMCETDETRGLIIITHNQHAHFATKPKNESFVEALTKSALQENLSKAALEVLSIIAYRAPISRSEIDAIRGVNCSFTLRNLLLRSLIEREGNPAHARGYVYRPSSRFLEVLGLGSIEALPDYEKLSSDERLKMILEEDTVPERSKENKETEE